MRRPWRYRSTLHRAWITAGPPRSWNAAGFGIGAVPMVIGLAMAASTTPDGSIPPDTWLLVLPFPVIGVFVAGLADRAGWRIRAAIGEYLTSALARWPDRPMSDDAARTWLTTDAGRDATPIRRASIHFQVRDHAAAEDDLKAMDDPSPVERAFMAQLRAQLDLERTGALDIRPAQALAAGLDPPERHFRLLALAWIRAVDDLEHVRPWRDRYLEAIAGLDPFPVPRGVRLRIAIVQLRYGLVLPALVVPLAILLGNTI